MGIYRKPLSSIIKRENYQRGKLVRERKYYKLKGKRGIRKLGLKEKKRKILFQSRGSAYTIQLISCTLLGFNTVITRFQDVLLRIWIYFVSSPGTTQSFSVLCPAFLVVYAHSPNRTTPS